MTMGPYQATGSPMGRPEIRRKRTGPVWSGYHHLVAIPVQDDSPVATDAAAVEIEIIGPDDFVGVGVPLRVEVAFPFNDVGQGRVAAPDGMMELGPGRNRDIEVFRVGDDVL